MKRNVVSVVVLLAALGLAGCPANNQVFLPPPGTVAITRLYVSNCDTGILHIFAPPFSALSTPAVSFQVPGTTDVDDVAFDSMGHTFVGDFGTDHVKVFATPITGSSTLAFSIVTGSGPEGIDVDAAGNLYVANEGSGNVTIYNAPLSGASTASTTISVAQPIGVKLDASGNLYVSSHSLGNVQIFHPPFSNASTPAVTIATPGVWGIFVDKATGNLWAVERSTHTVVEFLAPLSNASTASLSISSGLTDPGYPALDASGNLFVSDFSGGAAVRVYNAPLSNASTPAFSFAAACPNGIRFGP